MRGPATDAEQYDVVIIGAGISGIGMAWYVKQAFPQHKILILEARDSIGGTWDLFRYPGIRSDSDLHTFAYEFKPWLNESAIADAHLIRDYLRETAEEFGLTELIRFRHAVTSADWSSREAMWTLGVQSTSDGGATSQQTIRANWVIGATGYYRYDEGFTPQFPGRDDFAGDIIHPQHWPEGYDYSGKKVVVIGSGATAITLVPAMAMGEDAAAHVTMLQRTPSYILSMPRVDSLALLLTKVFGHKRGYAITRTKNILLDWSIVNFLLRFPKAGRALIRYYNKKELPAGFDVDKHFNPPYDPWDQRLCLAADSDLFKVIREGSASVVTDQVETITETGIKLASGEELEADVIVTATGLNMKLLAGISMSVDGTPIKLSESTVYRGMLLSGIPNWSLTMGYTKSSWTLRIKLAATYLCELFEHMRTNGCDTAVPVAERGMPTRPFAELTSGYMQRTMHEHPTQGGALPWRLMSNYLEDRKMSKAPLVDGHLRFSTSSEHEPATETAASSAEIRTDQARTAAATPPARAGASNRES